MLEHYDPTLITIAERFVFHQQSQGPQETVTEYMAELRRLATHCNFGDFLSQALRNRFVCGLRDTTQKRLLLERMLELQKALEIAQGMEVADVGAKRLQKQSAEAAAAVGQVAQRLSTRREPSGVEPGQTKRVYYVLFPFKCCAHVRVPFKDFRNVL